MDVTILIPIYNNSVREIEQTLESAFKQDTASVMVYDDGSYDWVGVTLDKVTTSLLERFRGDENKGRSYATNFMIKKVKTKYYIMLDCGDTYTSPNSVKTLMKYIGDKDICYGDFKLEEGEWRYGDYSEWSKKDILELIVQRNGSGIIPFNHCLHKTDFTISNNLFFNEELKVGEDTYRFIEALNCGLTMRYTGSLFINYNRNPNSISLNQALRDKDLPKIIEFAKKSLDK